MYIRQLKQVGLKQTTTEQQALCKATWNWLCWTMAILFKHFDHSAVQTKSQEADC